VKQKRGEEGRNMRKKTEKEEERRGEEKGV